MTCKMVSLVLLAVVGMVLASEAKAQLPPVPYIDTTVPYFDIAGQFAQQVALQQARNQMLWQQSLAIAQMGQPGEVMRVNPHLMDRPQQAFYRGLAAAQAGSAVCQRAVDRWDAAALRGECDFTPWGGGPTYRLPYLNANVYTRTPGGTFVPGQHANGTPVYPVW